MKRRDFLKSLSTPLIFGLAAKTVWADDEMEYARSLKIWSYYVPLTSYSGILEQVAEQNPLDKKVIFEEVTKMTDRISGSETDGTKNPASFEITDLEKAEEYIRVHFWHDDNRAGHSLYIFKRYLEDLQQGKKVFVATNMYQNHFHVVLIRPPTED